MHGLGTGAGRAGGAVAPSRIETGADASAPLAPLLSVFLKAAAALKASFMTPRILSIEPVSMSDRGTVPEADGAQTINLRAIASHLRLRGRGWSHLSHDPQVGRRMAVLELAFESDEYLYLADIERRPESASESFAVICFANPSLRRIGLEHISEIAEAVIQKRGWPRVELKLRTSSASYLADTTPHVRIAATKSEGEESKELDQFCRRLHNLVFRVRQASIEEASNTAQLNWRPLPSYCGWSASFNSF